MVGSNVVEEGKNKRFGPGNVWGGQLKPHEFHQVGSAGLGCKDVLDDCMAVGSRRAEVAYQMRGQEGSQT